ncbi:MAG: glycosyltransferase family 2 protein [Gaiellaceae bacterium]
MNIVMTLLVRDAQQLLRANLDFHLRQGVDYFVITDNLSADGTAAIAREYVAAGLAELIFEPSDTYDQDCWVTRMARIAAARGADWVIHCDDDEFWRPRRSTLREVLASLPHDVEAVKAKRFNHPPLTGIYGTSSLSTMMYRETESRNALGLPLPPKVAHRAAHDVVVEQGNHDIRRGDAVVAAAECPEIEIHHYPMLDYQSFERKIAHGGAAYARNDRFPPEVGATWRSLYALLRAGELRRYYDEHVLDAEAIARGLLTGWLVHDDSIVRSLGGPAA